jgi:hypothetical protein
VSFGRSRFAVQVARGTNCRQGSRTSNDLCQQHTGKPNRYRDIELRTSAFAPAAATAFRARLIPVLCGQDPVTLADKTIRAIKLTSPVWVASSSYSAHIDQDSACTLASTLVSECSSDMSQMTTPRTGSDAAPVRKNDEAKNLCVASTPSSDTVTRLNAFLTKEGKREQEKRR